MEPFQLRIEDEKSSLLMLHSWCERNGITAGFTTRQAKNTALHVGDDPGNVLTSRNNIAEELSWRFEAFTCAEQVHGNDVYVISSEDIGRGRLDRESAIPNTDALITNESDVLLAMYFADCVPLYFHDPVTGSLGLAHAGWKGTVSEIAVKTVAKMQAVYGAEPENILAAIGPSIGSCCYEVDRRVLQHVRPLIDLLRAGNPIIEESSIVISSESEGRAYLDLKHLNRELMIKAGILPSRIEMSSWCTSCRTDLFFSHRKENGVTGRMMSWLGRKSR
ncbi:peptidoglycan editing factor PgeF [Cohnella cholangitidis]|uniref:Purine nucleoside phosphorylase n=1 Tax=Cohnella cholangitidis TaxID=2598458 RepID=A0A7G5BTT5_9BACL|nr:peptidoglycan editing factor PgeF [Cohnella cholangitidis]QMV40369.1 peptidoglycan editing factor PgeF [Cohnella cholangitidis]